MKGGAVAVFGLALGLASAGAGANLQSSALAVVHAVVDANVGASSDASARTGPSASAQDAAPQALGAELDARTVARLLRLERPNVAPPDPTNRVADDPRAAQLGQFLFFDTRLSSDGTISCATCHDPARAFSDGKVVAEGVGRAKRNSPGLLDAALQRWLFWDGRADSLWAQALQPLENQVEMGGSRVDLARLLASDADLRRAYESVFAPLPDLSDARRFPPGARPCAERDDAAHRAWTSMAPDDRILIERIAANACKSIAAYERRLLPRGSPFDALVAAVRARDAHAAAAYPAAALRGFKLFFGKADCRQCHGNARFSDQAFHNIGVADRDESGALGRETRDPGRYAGIEKLLADPLNARGLHSDARASEAALELEQLRQTPETWGTQRTPSLRNVALTAPYMHQGQLATLRDVLRYYSTLDGAVPAGHHGETVLRKLELSDAEIDDLLAFLESLTDPPLPVELTAKPARPWIEPAPASNDAR